MIKRARAWLRWEFSRTIEVTPAIRLITVERFAKGGILVLGGLVLLVISNRGNGLRDLAENLQTQLNLDPGRGFVHNLYVKTLVDFGGLSRLRQDAIGVGAILYGLLEVVEGIGLLRRRRWAEYLVLIATAAFLPLEIDELLHRATPLKAGALVVNLLIMGYLVWRKRLFLEREGSGSQPA